MAGNLDCLRKIDRLVDLRYLDPCYIPLFRDRNGSKGREKRVEREGEEEGERESQPSSRLLADSERQRRRQLLTSTSSDSISEPDFTIWKNDD